MNIIRNNGVKVEDITDSQIVVGFISGDAVMLVQEDYRRGDYKWLMLQDATRGNTYVGGATIAEAINHRYSSEAMRNQNPRFEVFNDWQEAMRWLLNNE